MNKLYDTLNPDSFINYKKFTSKNSINNFCVVFVHGLMSNMLGTKATQLSLYANTIKYDFIAFDNFGHGNSSGRMIDQNISSWLNGLELVLDKLVGQNQKVILVGSSMGGWISLLAAEKYPNKIHGIIGLAAAPDFTEEIVWNKLPHSKQEQMMNDGFLEFFGVSKKDSSHYSYKISYDLVLDGRKHLILNKDSINIKQPVHLIHSLLDDDVPYETSMRLFKKIKSHQAVLKYIKDGDHRLSREQDLVLILDSIKWLMNILNFS
ncbi:MAG: alpha/beta hydrolase [Rickettsiaceae bacterium]